VSRPDAELGHRTYRALQRQARGSGRPTAELLQLYALEGFLARLARSAHRDQLVLKGGMLLAVLDARRPTRDIDLQAQRLRNDIATVRDAVDAVAAIELDDGLVYDTETTTAQAIREDDVYAGVRVSLDAGLATARLRLKVDVNVGDPIWPHPEDVELTPLLNDEPIRVRGYPLHMMYAEKIVTALQRGTANTRWRDFADLYVLTSTHDHDAATLRGAIEAVATYRHASLQPLAAPLKGYAELAQDRWDAWRRKHQLDDRLPESFAELLDGVTAFADPVLEDPTFEATWHARERTWH